MNFLYDCNCEDCKAEKSTITLAQKDRFKGVLKAVEKAFKKLHQNGKYSPEDLAKTKEYKNLISETSAIFDSAIVDNDMPEAMTESLKKDVFIFSGLKTNAQLLEASKLLLNEDNQLKSFSQFSKDIKKIKEDYNQNYLEAEYQFAVSSAQSAANWANVSKDYDLQYRTANDDKVRASHAVLHNITLPADDDFWISFYPPNGWRCRCTAPQVRKGKYEVSDSKKAIASGEKATTQIDKDGKNKLAIFRFNPGMSKKIFPPEHPYSKVAGAKTAVKDLKELK
ncbi:phage head morphogenesis protein [Flavobacterium sp. TR2]|uniref:phage head morphogenesis protein n=1 Tax=Flavobacterium sp. TR2 TaxID=2977321 RepID=UPI0021B124FC|nr:phage head morphogenesis protein [Flavobacterium sp. TR2]UWY28817.1 phage head morphogenesis protein [Flavobacterium sp. TR2]